MLASLQLIISLSSRPEALSTVAAAAPTSLLLLLALAIKSPIGLERFNFPPHSTSLLELLILAPC